MPSPIPRVHTLSPCLLPWVKGTGAGGGVLGHRYSCIGYREAGGGWIGMMMMACLWMTCLCLRHACMYATHACASCMPLITWSYSLMLKGRKPVMGEMAALKRMKRGCLNPNSAHTTGCGSNPKTIKVGSLCISLANSVYLAQGRGGCRWLPGTVGAEFTSFTCWSPHRSSPS